MIRIAKNKIIVTGEHAAHNMAYQGQNNGLAMGEMEVLTEIYGK